MSNRWTEISLKSHSDLRYDYRNGAMDPPGGASNGTKDAEDRFADEPSVVVKRFAEISARRLQTQGADAVIKAQKRRKTRRRVLTWLGAALFVLILLVGSVLLIVSSSSAGGKRGSSDRVRQRPTKAPEANTEQNTTTIINTTDQSALDQYRDIPVFVPNDLRHSLTKDLDLNPYDWSSAAEDEDDIASSLPLRKMESHHSSESSIAARVVGGSTVTELDKYPFYVRIDKNLNLHCGGSLVSPSVVLTAGHCMPTPDDFLTATINGNTLSDSSHPTDRFIFRGIRQMIPHPKLDLDNFSYDYMLLELDGPPLTEEELAFYKPIQINRDATVPEAGTTLTIMGLGKTDPDVNRNPSMLQEVEIDAVGFESCERAYSRVLQGSEWKLREEIMLCAGGDGLTDSCQGDSGGPIVEDLNGDGTGYIQYGVVSFGWGCANEGYPGIYARTSAIFDWMQTVICTDMLPQDGSAPGGQWDCTAASVGTSDSDEGLVVGAGAGTPATTEEDSSVSNVQPLSISFVASGPKELVQGMEEPVVEAFSSVLGSVMEATYADQNEVVVLNADRLSIDSLDVCPTVPATRGCYAFQFDFSITLPQGATNLEELRQRGEQMYSTILETPRLACAVASATIDESGIPTWSVETGPSCPEELAGIGDGDGSTGQSDGPDITGQPLPDVEETVVEETLDVKDDFNCEVLDDALEVRWQVSDNDSITIELVGRIGEGSYMAFGPSGSNSFTTMIGADVVVANTLEAGSPRADDYTLRSKGTCVTESNTGVCPDLALGGTDDINVISAFEADGYTFVSYQRPLTATDPVQDRPISVNPGEVTYVAWAIGPMDADTSLPLYHTSKSNGDVKIDFGRGTANNCGGSNDPSVDLEDVPLAPTDAPTSIPTATPSVRPSWLSSAPTNGPTGAPIMPIAMPVPPVAMPIPPVAMPIPPTPSETGTVGDDERLALDGGTGSAADSAIEELTQIYARSPDRPDPSTASDAEIDRFERHRSWWLRIREQDDGTENEGRQVLYGNQDSSSEDGSGANGN